MNNKPDANLPLCHAPALPPVARVPRVWPPLSRPQDLSVSHGYWLTRGARGISWHSGGRASQGRLQ